MTAARLFPRQLRLGAIVIAVPIAAIAACDDASSTAPPLEADGGSVDSGRDSSKGKAGDVEEEDAGPKTTCSITRAYVEVCGGGPDDLNCGVDGYDAWCKANDQAINSEAYRRAEELCLTEANCDLKKRHACEYTHYNDETPTPSQEAVVTAYCETCEPSDVSGCTTRSTKFDPAKGVDSIDDIFIAAWELADDVVDEIKTKCTGSTVDAGAACADAFAGCAADVYLARVPDCP